MKRFLVFAGEDYYPRGGWNDLQGRFDTQLEAEHEAKELLKKGFDWNQIVDTGYYDISEEEAQALNENENI